MELKPSQRMNAKGEVVELNERTLRWEPVKVEEAVEQIVHDAPTDPVVEDETLNQVVEEEVRPRRTRFGRD